jgi:hypothetical protein
MIDNRIEYWKSQINLFGKQSIYYDDIELIEKTFAELKEVILELETELMMLR